MKLKFPPPPRIGRVAIELSELEFGYEPDTQVFKDLNLHIEGKWKVALVGPNGAGKTTLLKLIAGALEPGSGTRKLGHNVNIGYFAQHQIEALNPNNTVLEELEQVLPRTSQVRARDLLGRFLFSADSVFKPVSVLSGGEKTRLALAKLLASPNNLLCLDEPTNHLDMQSRDIVGEALEEFPGAIVLITHDRNLIRGVANRIVQVRAGKVSVFDGDYDYYLQKRDGTISAANDSKPPSPEGQRREQINSRKEQTLARRMRVRLSQIERDIKELTALADEAANLLSNPDSYSGSAREEISDLVNRYENSTRKIRDLETEWYELAARIDK